MSIQIHLGKRLDEIPFEKIYRGMPVACTPMSFLDNDKYKDVVWCENFDGTHLMLGEVILTREPYNACTKTSSRVIIFALHNYDLYYEQLYLKGSDKWVSRKSIFKHVEIGNIK